LKIFFTHPIFKIIAEVAEETNKPTYVVGGYVRDIILNRPSNDIDIVTVGKGIDLAEKVAEKTGEHTKISIFKNFGTAMFLYKDVKIEFVGARKESYQTNSRKPFVEDGTLEDDLKRRDFTINTLAIQLQKNNTDKNQSGNCLIIDIFNGLKDIENKIIKTPLNPDITFSDDPLRMIRAIRFATQLNFEIEQNSLSAIKQNADRINIVSKERISEELNKIILADKPSIGFKLLFDTGLLKIIFPQLYNLYGVDVINGKKHKDNFYHTLNVLDNIALKSDNLWLRWAAILHDIAKPLTKKFSLSVGWSFHGHEFFGAKMTPLIFKELRLPLNEKMKYVQKLVSLHHRPLILSKDQVTDSAIRRLLFDAGNDIDDLMSLCDADITSKNPERVRQYLKNFQTVRAKLKEIEEKDKIKNWQPPVSGSDIMKAFDLNPCREVGIIKNAIREAILDGEIKNNYKDAYTFMLKKGKSLGLTLKNK